MPRRSSAPPSIYFPDLPEKFMTTATAIEISMPKLSDSMEEGTILSWLAKAGAAVTVGQDLLEVETDKANMTVQAAGSGVLEILVGEGGTVAVGTPIARLGDGAAAAPSAEPLPPAVPGKRLRSTPLARRAARDHGIAQRRRRPHRHRRRARGRRHRNSPFRGTRPGGSGGGAVPRGDRGRRGHDRRGCEG
jgi:pyruvate/2-oxoglutarate dehydrogenase complex dihydrolipoamide acyltransferase (E2) component